MLLYTCKVRSIILSDECQRCFVEQEEKLASSRPLCVQLNVTDKIRYETVAEEKTKTKQEFKMSTKETVSAEPKKVKPIVEKKSAKTSPYFYAAELLLERKFTDEEIFLKIEAQFGSTGFQQKFISIVRSQLNIQGYRKIYPKATPAIERISRKDAGKPSKNASKEVKTDKPAPEAKVALKTLPKAPVKGVADVASKSANISAPPASPVAVKKVLKKIIKK